MLEMCVSLVDCERVLIEEFRSVTFLGEIELSSEDVQRLNALIITELDPDPKLGLKLLRHRAPASIAAFLVWQGIIGYGEGDYWTSALRAIGLDEPRWQQEFGEAFISFLRRMDLPDLPIKDALRFVTPILLHGGIPQKCLDQFFDHVIMDMAKFGIITGDEIRDYLCSLRDAEATRVALRRKLQNLKRDKSKYRKDVENLTMLIRLKQQEAKLEQVVGTVDEWQHVPENYEDFRADKLNEIEDINREISGLQSEARLCQDLISAFTPEDEAFLELGSSINTLGEELATVLRDKAELVSVRAEEAAYVAQLDEYTDSEALSGLPLDTMDTWDSLVETASNIDVLQSRLSELHNEASQVVPQPAKPGISFWIGSAFLLTALFTWVIMGHSPLGLGIAIAFTLGGCIFMLSGAHRLWQVYRDNKHREARSEAISKEVSEIQSKIADYEKAVSLIIEDLPHDLQAITETIIAKTDGFSARADDFNGGTDDSNVGADDACAEARGVFGGVLAELRSVGDTYACYHRCLARKKELRDSIAGWEHKLDELLSEAGLPGLQRKSQLENKNRPEIPSGIGHNSRQQSIDDFCDSNILKSAVELLEVSFADAFKRSRDCKNAKIRLTEDIQPEPQVLQSEAQEIETHIAELDESIIELGEGSLDTGISELKSKYKAFRELEKVNADIFKSEQTLFPLADMQGDAIDDLLRLQDKRLQAAKELTISIGDTEAELTDYSEAYSYTDEPVQRFVIYGDEWAEKWIIGTMELLECAHRGETISDESVPDLPRRVVHGFKEWWQSHKAAIQDEGFSYEYSGERLPTPQIRLDPIHADIKIVVDPQRFKLEHAEGASSFSILITSPTRPGWSKTLPLEAKRSRISGLAETEGIEYVLPILDNAFLETDGSTTVEVDPGNLVDDDPGPVSDDHSGTTEVSPITRSLPGLAGEYQVSMLIGDAKHVTWDLKVFDENTPCLIFSEDGKLVDTGYLPRARLWFVLPRDWGFTKRVPMIGDATPLYLKDACRIVLMDLGKVDTVFVGDGREKGFEFRVTRDKVSEPTLVGGQLISGVSIDDNPLYIGAPPYLMIPLSDDTKASAWDVVIRLGGGVLAERKQVRLDELCSIAGVSEMDGSVEIPLRIPELLGSNPIGRYAIHLRHRGRIRSQFSFGFVVVPDFWYQFEPSVVFPIASDESGVRLLVSVPDGARLNVHSPSVILSSEDGEYQVQVDPAESVVTGMLELVSPEDEMHTFPISINVPKIRWRLKEGREDGDTDWSCHVEEAFVSDLNRPNILLLQLELPADISCVHFALDDKQYDKAFTQSGKAEVNLLQFMDTLKAGGSVGEITARLLDSSGSSVGEGPILSLRCRWEVSDFVCVKEKSQGIWNLEFTWQEKGQAEDRILRMWRMWEPWAKPLEWHIPEGEMHLAVNVDEDYLPQGPYLVKFSVLDRWAPAGAGYSFPGDKFNTFIVHLHHDRPYLKVWDIHWLSNYEAKITGSVVCAPTGTDVGATLFGVRAGQACFWTAHGKTDSIGRFRVHVRGSPVQEGRRTNRDSIKNAARWIGITIDSEPKAHLFAVLPEHAPLEWWFAPKPASPFLLEWPLAPKLREAFLSQEVSSLPGLLEQASSVDPSFTEHSPTIRIQCEEGYLEEPDLSKRDSLSVISAWFKGSHGVDVKISFRGGIENMSLSWPELGDFLRIIVPTGVRCTTCGKIEPDHQSWHKYHSQRRSPCKGVDIATTEIPASLLIVEDPLGIALAELATYSLARDYPLTLYSSSTHGALPSELSSAGDSNDYLLELAKFLLSLERQLISALLRSEGKNGYEPH